MKLSKAYQDINTLLRLRTYPMTVKYFPSLDEDPEVYLMNEGFVRPRERASAASDLFVLATSENRQAVNLISNVSEIRGIDEVKSHIIPKATKWCQNGLSSKAMRGVSCWPNLKNILYG